MENLTFYILDVFAEEKYAGNQLAVFLHAGSLSSEDMQRLAREMNYSETTFITSDSDNLGTWDVRIFTPNEEVPFAGHPTLGTAYVIRKELIGSQVDSVILNLKVGHIPVTFSKQSEGKDILWMEQKRPRFKRDFEPGPIADVLTLNISDIDERFPVQEVSTGLPFIIIPLKNLDAVKRAVIARDKYFELIKNTDAKAVLIFCPETYNPENQLNARVFADFYGVPEDPATGSANGCLAGYLNKHKYFGDGNIDIRVEQGFEIGRPSILYLNVTVVEGVVDINVGGKVFEIAKGQLL